MLVVALVTGALDVGLKLEGEWVVGELVATGARVEGAALDGECEVGCNDVGVWDVGATVTGATVVGAFVCPYESYEKQYTPGTVPERTMTFPTPPRPVTSVAGGLKSGVGLGGKEPEYRQ